MILPLKKTLSVTMALVTLLLVVLLALGFRQYQMHRQHQEVIRQTEQLLFQFSLIREHIVESLLNSRPEQLRSVSREMEAFHTKVARVMENAFIPDEYKLAFASQVDLPGLVLLLRTPAELQEAETAAKLNEAVRSLGERLTFFDRLVMNHAKRQVVDFQTTVIGILALTVVGLVTLLFAGYRRLAVPLFGLISQVREVREGKRERLSGKGRWHEVRALAALIDEPLGALRLLACRESRQQNMLLMIKEALESLAEAGSPQELYQGMSKALLANPGYCLVWIGVPERPGGDLLPVAAEGASTMTGRECTECMAVLRSAAETHGKDQDQALAVFRTGQMLIRHDILAGEPRGLFKNTPLAEGKVSCAAMPIRKGEEVLGVANLYSLAPGSFELAEVELLGRLLDLLGATIGLLDQEANRKTTAASRLLASPEAAGEMALEINNLCNGIINYAQLLTDELGQLPAAEQETLLGRIISEGERIAELTRPLLAIELERPRGGEEKSFK